MERSLLAGRCILLVEDEPLIRLDTENTQSPASGSPREPDNLADDLLRGAEAIADFLYGDATKRRKIYHLAETSRLPIFRLGPVLCARRSILLKWIAEQEQRGWRIDCPTGPIPDTLDQADP
jgi:hypothetical protein